jgi:hypothetical protein
MKGYTAVKSTATEPLNRLPRETRTDYQGTLIASVKMAEIQFRVSVDLQPVQVQGCSRIDCSATVFRQSVRLPIISTVFSRLGIASPFGAKAERRQILSLVVFRSRPPNQYTWSIYQSIWGWSRDSLGYRVRPPCRMGKHILLVLYT